jgi:transposase InsO family protein
MKDYQNCGNNQSLNKILKNFNPKAFTKWQYEILCQRLLVLQVFDSTNNVKKTAELFKTSRSHIQKLIKIRKKIGLGGLIPIRPGPKLKRGFKLFSAQKIRIEQIAESFPDFGHKKLAPYLPEHSASTIYRYLSHKGMLVRNRCPAYHRKIKPRNSWKIKRKRLPQNYPTLKPGDLIVIDSITEFVGPNFRKLYFICCVDMATRIALAIATDRHNSIETRELLSKMEMILQTKIKAVLSDNGSEFLAYFHKACLEKNIEHFFSRPRTPKDNAVCERFNQTLQRGFYWRCDLEKPLFEINQNLTKWLIEYNIKRPHESLNLRPPCAVYFNKFYISRPREVYSRLWNRTTT